VIGTPGQPLAGEAVEGDAEEEESATEEAEDEVHQMTPAKKRRVNEEKDEEEEVEPPLFAPDPDIFLTTPRHRTRHPQSSSSPMYPPSLIRDYSSDLDMSSPGREWDNDGFEKRFDEEEVDDEDEVRKPVKVVKKRKREKQEGDRERTRHYEVVGVVRKKVVFALR